MAPQAAVSPDAAQAYFERLGNLALLEGKPNWTLGNTDFAMKAQAYRASSFKLTRQVGDSSSWGIREIETRQKHLARLALTAWRI